MSFTTELLLPSRGIIYNVPDFNGVINIKPFTTRLYKELLTNNASEQALKQFIEACLVDCPITAKSMNQNDLLATLFKIRVITLGNKLKSQIVCPNCERTDDSEIDLNEIEIDYLYTDKYPITLKLPDSNKDIKIRFVTGDDIARAKLEAEKRAKLFKKSMNEFLQIYSTVSVLDVDGKDIIEKAEWYESLNPLDAVCIDEAMSEMSTAFGIKLTKEHRCKHCEHTFNSPIDIGSDFFRPRKQFSLGITSQTGYLGNAAT